MGELICVCRFASLVVCSSCQYAKDHNPDKAWNDPRWAPKEQQQGNQSGLDDLADEIISGLDKDDIEWLGLRPTWVGPKIKAEEDR